MSNPTGRVSKKLRILVLGGTRFVGRAFVDAALEKGHDVALFNRGLTNPGLFEGTVEEIRGDRTADLSPLAGRRWDAVVDVAAYHPAVVRRSLEALSGITDRYLFVSTISVYADHRTPSNEESPVLEMEDPDDEGPESYGARKAACETLVTDALGERATIVRPGLIVGPHDPTERFSYWPTRIAEGGRVLAPGDPADPVQFIDVRDLADFMLCLVEDGRAGTLNATGHTMAFGDLLEDCRRVCGVDPDVVWMPGDRLLAAGLDPWMGVPLWIGDPEFKAANEVDITRALRAGLVFRDLKETIEAALVSEPPVQPTTFTRAKESELLHDLT